MPNLVESTACIITDPSHKITCVCHARNTLVFPSDRDSLQSGLSNIEDAIQELNARKIVLRRLANAALPIARLPPELLSRIMLLAARHRRKISFLQAEDTDWLPKLNEPLLALRFSHVSREFREIALGSPLLWAAPRRLEDDMDQEIFARSQQALLSIVWSFALVDRPGMFRTRIKGHMARTELLCTEVNSLNTDLLWGPAPFLNTLFVVAQEPSDVIRLPTFAPRLHTLALRTHGTSYQSPILVNLFRLSLDGARWNTPQDVLNMLGTIEMAPRLRELRVRLRYRHEDHWDPVTIPLGFLRPVLSTMPNLHEVQLVGDFVCLLSLFQHLQPTPGLQVLLKGVRDEGTDEAELDALFDFLNTFTAREGRMPTRVSFVEFELMDILFMRLSNAAAPDASTSVGISLFQAVGSFHHRIPDLMYAIRWGGIRELDLRLVDTDYMAVLLRSLEAFAGIHTINIHSYESFGELLKALRPRTPDVVPFPGLAKLIINLMDLGTADFIIDDAIGSELPISALLRTLNDRSQQGAPLSSITICRCNLEFSTSNQESSVSLLRSVIKEVQVMDEVLWLD